MVCIFQQEIKISLEVYQLSGTGGIGTFLRHLVAEFFGDPADIILSLIHISPKAGGRACGETFAGGKVRD